jgi:chorismate mutase / prephenate dehydratase
MSDLDYLRDQIDTIDEALVKLFFERMEIVQKVAEYKAKNSMKVLDKTREEKIKSKFLDKIVDEDKKILLSEFLESLMSISKNLQDKNIL